MTATQQFIEDAIAGGYTAHFNQEDVFRQYVQMEEAVSHILLDPLAWQAVGETRGWGTLKEDTDGLPEGHPKRIFNNGWRGQWMRFIDHLADGKTIDEALEAIS